MGFFFFSIKLPRCFKAVIVITINSIKYWLDHLLKYLIDKNEQVEWEFHLFVKELVRNGYPVLEGWGRVPVTLWILISWYQPLEGSSGWLEYLSSCSSHDRDLDFIPGLDTGPDWAVQISGEWTSGLALSLSVCIALPLFLVWIKEKQVSVLWIWRNFKFQENEKFK